MLIIGILAAVALPQYRKAVAKARITEAIVNLRAIVKAMELSELENSGDPVVNFEALSVIPVGELKNATRIDGKNFKYILRDAAGLGQKEKFEVSAYPLYSSSDMDNFYIYYAYDGRMYCVPQTEEAKFNCKIANSMIR